MKKIACAVLLIVILSSFSFASHALEHDPTQRKEDNASIIENDPIMPEDDSFLTSFGLIIIPSVEVFGHVYSLYPEYDCPLDVLEEVQNEYQEEISSLVSEFRPKVVSINECSWMKSQAAVQFDATGDIRMTEIVRVMDILENTISNNEIREFLAMTELDKGMTAQIGYELARLLPAGTFSSPSYEQQDRSWSLSNAITYAETYYDNYNNSYRNFAISLSPGAGDCANFGSQIRYAGGRTMYATWNYYGFFNFTDTWAHSDDYMKFLLPVTKEGVSNPTASFINFSRLIEPGDFVTYDFDNDGDYDHVGFITEADEYRAYWRVKKSDGTDYGTVYYWDFKVAQHTSDYNEWASGANCKNNWDVLPFTYPSIVFYVCQP